MKIIAPLTTLLVLASVAEGKIKYETYNWTSSGPVGHGDDWLVMGRSLPSFEFVTCSFEQITFTFYEPKSSEETQNKDQMSCGDTGNWYIKIGCDGKHPDNGRFPYDSHIETHTGDTVTMVNTGRTGPAGQITWNCQKTFEVNIHNYNNNCDSVYYEGSVLWGCEAPSLDANGSKKNQTKSWSE